ncbi:MAG: hypothetical protein PHF84_01730 [bacterium]|nr:hypothetical protein [bacterium]
MNGTRRMALKRFYYILVFLVPFFFSCSGNQFKRWADTEEMFYKGNYPAAVNEIRDLVNEASTKDKLLFLMEAGIILHTMGDYKKSNAAFEEADQFAQEVKKSVSKGALAFLLSDKQQNFTGENFERVLIKFYMALNCICLNDYEAAKRYFRQLDFELKEMKYEDDKYKQNLAARFLDAVLSENLGNFNDARAQYKNLIAAAPEDPDILAGRYMLAVKEQDPEDIRKYQAGSRNVLVFNNRMEPVPYRTNMGELVLFHQAGKGPIKKSRGTILSDEGMMIALRAAIELTIATRGEAISTAAVIAMMGTAENPIPVYQERDQQAAEPAGLLLKGVPVGRTGIMNNYTETALRNYNDQYTGMVTKNVASIALKIVVAAVAANELRKKANKASGNDPLVGCLGGFLIGAGAGKAVALTVQPDLRCWRLLPSNFQVKRIFLEPGEYDLSIQYTHPGMKQSPVPEKVTIKPRQLLFVNFRSMSQNQSK